MHNIYIYIYILHRHRSARSNLIKTGRHTKPGSTHLVRLFSELLCFEL